jgi:hypothetical protein
MPPDLPQTLGSGYAGLVFPVRPAKPRILLLPNERVFMWHEFGEDAGK